ncbi:MAG TPA: FAD-dependent oxidoreductase [Candidatus Acidoferrum sp.]|nr:FAD-dependent oxidoreductase [Candidatus Acidoferrum sp.]
MADTSSTRCCIAGGGPAGMMLGLLLARAGVDVIVLEKHADFLRDFRGDTIHPSTLEVVHELGLLDALLQLPHQKVYEIGGLIEGYPFTLADFRHLPVRAPFIAFMPQWDFLDFLAREAGRYPGFHLMMRAEATDLVEESGRVTGVHVTTPEGPITIRADLVIGADGRSSVIREKAGLPVQDFGAPMDVLWFRLSHKASDPQQALGRIVAGRIFVMLNRGDYWQCGYVIAKGQADRVRAAGLPAFREGIVPIAPHMRDRVNEIATWDDVKLLTVQVNRLTRWSRAGLLCIGDAAHAMSPVAGVGINLAVQDAVAAANILAAPLRAQRVTLDDLQRVQKRREWPTRVTQRIQLAIQNRVIRSVLGATAPIKPPLVARLLARSSHLRRIPGRLIGLGVRPEHVHTPSIG